MMNLTAHDCSQASAALATLAIARADDYVDMATKAAKAATAHADKWDGPTTGPEDRGRQEPSSSSPAI